MSSSNHTKDNDKNEKTENTTNKDFYKLIKDMTNDILTTFPEYKETLDNHLQYIISNDYNESNEESLKYIQEYCKKVYPERFFDILYESPELFKDNNKTNVYFLPNIDFRKLWNENISDKTRETIWKYLQLVLFSTVSMVNDKTSFGDTEHLFQAIDEDEFKSKLEETLNNVQNMFDNNENENDNKSSFNMNDMPNAENIHEHVTNMMGGKLGSLAKEIAEETAEELNLNLENVNSIGDVFKNMFKKPSSIINLVKSVGTKLDKKLKSNDLKESDLLAEAGDMMKNMKNIPGMGNIQDMLSKMGMGNIPGMGNFPGFSGGVPKGGKMSMNALQSQLQKTMKMAKMQENLKQQKQKKTEEMQPQMTKEEMLKQEERARKAMAELLQDEENHMNSSFKKQKKNKKHKNK